MHAGCARLAQQDPCLRQSTPCAPLCFVRPFATSRPFSNPFQHKADATMSLCVCRAVLCRSYSRDRSRSPSEDGVGGYKPRKRQEPAKVASEYWDSILVHICIGVRAFSVVELHAYSACKQENSPLPSFAVLQFMIVRLHSTRPVILHCEQFM